MEGVLDVYCRPYDLCAGYLDYLFESWRVFLSKQVG
jgi:hypothetical protein